MQQIAGSPSTLSIAASIRARSLYQARIVPERQDNFSTYPYLQLAAGLPLLARAGEEAASGKLAPINVDLPSKLWSHPTLWSYLAAGLGRGAW